MLTPIIQVLTLMLQKLNIRLVSVLLYFLPHQNQFLCQHQFSDFIIIMNIFLKFEGQTSICTENELRDLLIENDNCGNVVTFMSEGKVCYSGCQFSNNQTVAAQSKLYGGKGGFGAKLKTEGGKKVRPNENMFSRDLQGQPVAYATVTKQYQDYYRNKLLQNQKVEKQLADFQVVSNTYKEDYVSTKLDSTYNAEMQENQKRLKEAMKIGMKKYLLKKNQGPQKSQQEKQEDKKQEEEDDNDNENENQDEHSKKFPEDVVNQQQNGKKSEVLLNNDEQIQGLKRQKPIGKVEQHKTQPSKKVKPNESEVQKKIQPTNSKNSTQKFLSARQKLKSLFKK